MLIKIPIEFRHAIENYPCQPRYLDSFIDNSIRIYTALYNQSIRKDKHGYFPVSSKHLKSIYTRYNDVRDYFIKCGLIEYLQIKHINPDDIFCQKTTKSYRVGIDGDGECMRYRFLVDTSEGEEIEVNMFSGKKERWYQILKNSLLEYGLDGFIKRDNFGRRVHHPGINNYKTTFKGLYVIDAKCSQPRLLYDLINQRGVIDSYYNFIFENDLDFYSVVGKKLNLSRNVIKDLFMFWINGKGFLPIQDEQSIIKHCSSFYSLFPVMCAYLKSLKKSDYKKVGSLLQRSESKIWIDNLLNNLPVSFGITIHDSLIVKENDLDTVLNYCRSKYSNVKFEWHKL